MFDGTADDLAAHYLQTDEDVAGETPVAKASRSEWESTAFIVNNPMLPWATTQQPLTHGSEELKPFRNVGHELPAEAVTPRDARVALLLRKYEGRSSLEDEARLAILTQRLRRLEPRVDSSAWDAAEAVLDDLEAVDARLSEIREEFGLE